MKVVLATRNRGKIREIKDILSHIEGLEILTLDDFPGIDLPPEDGETFRDNALKKARYVSHKTSLPALADDSGLEVDALGGRPGVYSSRYAGPDATDEENVKRLLDELRDVPFEERTARFRCVIAIVYPSGREETFEGVLEGTIATEPSGKGGFGYDPVFFVPSMGKTIASISSVEKNRISHRGIALMKARESLLRGVSCGGMGLKKER